MATEIRHLESMGMYQYWCNSLPGLANALSSEAIASDHSRWHTCCPRMEFERESQGSVQGWLTRRTQHGHGFRDMRLTPRYGILGISFFKCPVAAADEAEPQGLRGESGRFVCSALLPYLKHFSVMEEFECLSMFHETMAVSAVMLHPSQDTCVACPTGC